MKKAVSRTIIGLVLVVSFATVPVQAAGPVREPGPVGRFYNRIIQIIKNVVPKTNNDLTIPKP